MQMPITLTSDSPVITFLANQSSVRRLPVVPPPSRRSCAARRRLTEAAAALGLWFYYEGAFLNDVL